MVREVFGEWQVVLRVLGYVVLYGLVYLLLPLLIRRVVRTGGWKRDFHRFMVLVGFGVVVHGLGLVVPGWSRIVGWLSEWYLVHWEEIRISVRSLIEAVYVLLVLWYLVRFIRELVYGWMCVWRTEVEAGSWRSLITNLGILVVVMMFLLELGITWKVLLPFAGALGIGLGFGLQTIFNNYISGFILIISRNVKVGDLIEIEGNAGKAVGNETNIIYGKVVDVNVLTTRVHTVDGLEIAIPNAHFVSGKIINYTLSDELVRVHIPFGVAYSSDPLVVRRVLLDVARGHPGVERDPAPEVIFYEMADSALVFHLLVWVNARRMWRMLALRSEIYFEAWDRLKRAGIEVPFPQRDVWFRTPLRVEAVVRSRSVGGGGAD